MNTLNAMTDYRRRDTSPTRLSTMGKVTGQELASALSPVSNLRPRTIVAPFDFSDISNALLHRLISLAETSEMTVHVIHVVEPSGGVAANGETPINPGARAAARIQIEKWAAQHLPSQASITTTVRLGRAAEGIVAHAQALSADLIVMSAHVGSGRKNVLLRTTTERVVQLSPCPVLVVGRDQVQGFLIAPERFTLRTRKRVLLPLELSNNCREALAYAAAIVRENGARLHVLYCGNGLEAKSDETVSSVKERVSTWLGSELRQLVEYEATIWSNLPLLNAILHEVKLSNIDLIVLPARDCAWFQRHRLWSITGGILRHAPCPVLSINASIRSLAV